jgi:hypothetical protein
VNERLTSAGRYLASQPVDKLMKVLPALHYQCTDTVFMPAFAAEFPENLAALIATMASVRSTKHICAEANR